ncbi:hypothetical protein ACOMHN_050137 [Nucella lapillus]
MVQKTSHRGVHTGNTLRAFNSRYSRRYHKESCIVSRAHPKLINKMILGGGAEPRKAEKKEIKQVHNFAVNVALSLNKQARWLLPAALIRQVQTDDIADSELTVSVLERHKLKRPSSCVSFHSNKGEGKAKTENELGESEVRYEVYYPSPASSSISHNPKYIKEYGDPASGDGNEHVQHGKPKKQHRGKRRNRMSLKDIDDWELTACHSQPYQTLPSVAVIADQEEHSSLCEIKEEQNPTECLLSSLIDKAQQLQNFKGINKLRRKKSKASSHQEDDKSHIIYLDEFQENGMEDTQSDDSSPSVNPVSPSPSIRPVLPVPPSSTRVLLHKDDVTLASLRECFGESYFEVGCKPRKFIVDVTPHVQELLKKQGIQTRVAEETEKALSYLICVHDGFYDDEYNVYRVLLNTKLHDGLLALEINAHGHQDLFRGTVLNLISQTMDFMQGLVSSLKEKNYFPHFIEGRTAKASGHHLSTHLGCTENYVLSVKRLFQQSTAVVDNVMPTLADLLQEGLEFCDVCYDDISPLTHGSAPFTSLLTCQHQVCDGCWSQHVHVRLHEGFVRLTCPGYDCQEKVPVGMLLSVAPLNTVEKVLNRQEGVRIGASSTDKWCPNEACGRVISLQPSSCREELQFQQDVVCDCGSHVCFHCLQPAHWPASCTQAQQYRATVDVAAFPDRLAEVHEDFKGEEPAKLKRQQKIMTSTLVQGKNCPKCRNLVVKTGGCSQMTCSCGQLFCWFCAKPGYSHHSRSCVDELREEKLTTTVLVRHVDNNGKKQEQRQQQQQQQSASTNRRQRVSLMERAVECRQRRENKQKTSHAVTSLAKHVTTAAAKNTVVAQHVMKACSQAFPSLGQVSTELTSTLPIPVYETVTSFLKNAAHSKQELLEVLEYSLVLLKDLPDSLLRRRALRISEDLGAFCSFSQSVFDVWGLSKGWTQAPLQEAVKALMRLAEIQGWIRATLDTHVVTVRKLRAVHFPGQ